MIYCRHCGSPQEPNSFCRFCGRPLDTPAPAAPKTDGSFFNSLGNLGGDDLSAPEPAAPSPAPAYRAPAAPSPAPAYRAPTAPSPAPAAPTIAETKALHRIPVARELRLLLRQGTLILVGDLRNFIISLLFPVLAAIVTVWVAGKNMFLSFEATKSGCFILVCAAIWGGLFNSIQTLVKERDNIKRDYVSGALRIECYMGSRAIIQLALCAVQSLILTISIPAVEWVHGNNYPSSGLIFGSALVEFYFTLFLIMLASDALGLLISSMVKKEELASKLAPYILIAQLLFSGVLFKMEGGAKVLSSIMISRWGMEALGSISRLENQPAAAYYLASDRNLYHAQNCANAQTMTESGCTCANQVVSSLYQPDPSMVEGFDASSEHLLAVLLIMFGFVIVSLVAADLLLHRVKKDGRD